MATIIWTQQSRYAPILARTITTEIIERQRRVTFLDCLNRIDQYLFGPHHASMILDLLFIGRMERFHEFYKQLRSIHFDPYFRKSDVLLISSYQKLMEELSSEETVHFSRKIDESLQRIETRYKKEIIVIKILEPSQKETHDKSLS